MVLEWQDHLLLVDAGMLFPTAEMPGVDSIVPDFEYLAERREQLRGIVLTHGHEDHIGALSFALAAAPAPVYGSRLTLGFARRRLQERGVARRPADAAARRAGRDRALPRAPDPRRAQRRRQPGARDRDAGRRGAARAATSRSTARAPPEERTDVEALARVGRPRRAGAALRQHQRRAARAHAAARTPWCPPSRRSSRARADACSSRASRPRCRASSAWPALAARGGPRRSPSWAGAWSTTPRWRSTSACCACPAASRGSPADARRRARRRARWPVRLGQPGRAALGALAGQPGRAPRRRGRAGRHGGALGARDPGQRARRLAPDQQPATGAAATWCTRARRASTSPATAAATTCVELLRLTRPALPRPRARRVPHARAARAGWRPQAGLPGGPGAAGRGRRRAEPVRRAAPAARRRVAAGRVLLDRGGAGRGRGRRGARPPPPLRPRASWCRSWCVDRQTGQLESPPEIVTRGIVDTAEAAELARGGRPRSSPGRCDGRPVEERLDSELTRERVRDELRRFFKRRTQRRPMVIPVVMEV